MLVLFTITALLILYLQKLYMNLPNAIKGKKPLTTILFFNTRIKIFFIIILLITISQAIKSSNNLATELSSNQYWEKTQDIYATEFRFITQDTDKYRPYELKLEQFYKEAEKIGLFLIDVNNYDKLSNGQYLYEANTKDFEQQFISPSGRSITINRNYLLKNPIKKENNELVTENDILIEDNTLNILVPTTLKKYEEEITENFLNRFEFKKNLFDTVSNREDLNINIIFVKPEQSYFSYQPYIEQNNKNSIDDPIAIIDTNNIDPSFYGSWLTGSVFFEAKDSDGYSYILPSIKKTDTLANIQNVKSVYNEKVENINHLKQEILYLKIASAILFIAFILNCVSFFSAYFEKNKYSFVIKRVFGYSYLRILISFTILTLFVDIVTSFIILRTLNNIALFAPIIILLSIQIILLTVYIIFMNRKIAVILNKGELE